MKDYVVFYGPTDGASGYELRNAEKVIQSFNTDTEYTDINRVIELYNIKQYFDNEMYLASWNESTKNKYIDIVKKFDSVIGKYFSRVLGENIYDFFKSINVHYRYDFWGIVDCFGVYRRITSEQFTAMIKKDHVLVYILHCPKIVRKFGNEIAKELTTNIEYAETVLNYYIAKHTRNPKRKVYIPSELTAENKKSILKNYIEWERANPNYLHLISTFKKSDDFATDDRIRYAAHTKFNEYVVRLPVLKNVGNARHNVIKEIAQRDLCFHEHRRQLKILPREQPQLAIDFIRRLSWLQLLPICETKCCDFSRINFVCLGFTDVL